MPIKLSTESQLKLKELSNAWEIEEEKILEEAISLIYETPRLIYERIS